MSELISYCQACGEYGHKSHCGLEYLDAKADTDVWRTECNILKQTIKNLETGHQKELAQVTKERDEAFARIEKLESGEQCKDCQRFDEQHAKQHRINTQQAKRIEKLEKVREAANRIIVKKHQFLGATNYVGVDFGYLKTLIESLEDCEEKEPTT